MRCKPAYGYDFETGKTTYTGPKRITPPGTYHVREVVETGDFEGVLNWVIGLDAQRAFAFTAGGHADPSAGHHVLLTLEGSAAVEDDLAERRVGLAPARRPPAARSSGKTRVDDRRDPVRRRAAARRRARTPTVAAAFSSASRARSTVPKMESRLAIVDVDRQRGAGPRDRADDTMRPFSAAAAMSASRSRRRRGRG